MLTAAMSERDDFFDGDFAWNDDTLDTIAGPTPVTARDRVARAAQRVTGPRRMRFPDRRGLLRLGVLVPTTTILRPGDKGPAVRALQRALKQLGLLTAAVDGDFGPATQAAVV